MPVPTEPRQPRYARYPSLEGRVAFVTGGATGLGASFVSQLAGQGAHVAFVDIDVEQGEALAEEIARRGDPRPWFAECDVRDIAALRSVIAAAADRLGPIEVLVNNAASDTRHTIDDVVDPDFWDDRVNVNLRHHFFATQAVAPMMRAGGGGSVINLGSISAHIDLRDIPGYIASKAGIEGLTRALARDLGHDGIRVNCIIPGWIMTPRQLEHWVTPEIEENVIKVRQSLPRLLYPDDVARLVLWLAADDSDACTGQNWIVDGGWM